ncbi:MAG: hypothetical protein WA964_12510 [Ilumatobacter sp.]|uniref:hypothetical protein n=1 Tax=Ilumatobacter sp. TaxID=1967498 RepID=UPI003C76B8EF
MNLSDFRDAPDTASDAASDFAAATRRYVSDVSLPDVSMPDVSLPDALDIDVADLAGNAIEFAGDVAGAVVTQGGRGLAQVVRSARQNPKAAIGVVAIIVLVVGLIAAKRRSSETYLESIS